MTTKDWLGDQIKAFEARETSRRLMKGLPVVARLDGKAFHTFTRGLKKPYDDRLSSSMMETTKYLVDKTNALIGYTQSDEITLVWDFPAGGSEFMYDGKLFKLLSLLSAMATAKFNSLIAKNIPEKAELLPVFDARVFQMPNKELAALALVWRELDASKNSVSMAASAYYSHKVLQGKNNAEKQELLFQKGINWNDYPSFFKRGSYFRKAVVEKLLSDEELSVIPEAHRPTGLVKRNMMVSLEIPPITKISNVVEFVFEGVEPIIAEKGHSFFDQFRQRNKQ